jgi:hypothetical protein
VGAGTLSVGNLHRRNFGSSGNFEPDYWWTVPYRVRMRICRGVQPHVEGPAVEAPFPFRKEVLKMNLRLGRELQG